MLAAVLAVGVVVLLGGCSRPPSQVSSVPKNPRPIPQRTAPALSEAAKAARLKEARTLAEEHVRIQDPFLGLNFLLPGERLGIGYGRLGLPVSAFEKLYLEDEYGLMQVRGPSDLAGYVHIDSEAEALTFVRLFTSPATVRAFDPPVWLEVVPVSEVDEDLVFGRKSQLWAGSYVDDLRRTATTKGYAHEFGVLPDQEWRELGLQPPSVARSEDGFVVTRSLVEITEKSVWGTGVVQRIAEAVSPDGRVTRRVLSKQKVEGLLVSLSPEE